MLTRCPNCETTFRVTPEQLKARQGRVRCGECQEVFNALDTLVEAPAPAAPAALPTEDVAPVAAAEAVTADVTPTAAEESVTAEVEPVVEAKDVIEPAETTAVAEAVDAAPAESEILPEVPEEPPLPPQDEALAANDEWSATPPPRPRRWPWTLGALAAALVLAMQAIMHFRTEIAVLHPEARPLLLSACETFGCKLLLPRKAESMSIETSDLHPDAAGKLTLTATLKNRAPFAQEHPHLELTLTDTADKALVRRVLAPADYLPPTARTEAGFAAGKEIPVDLAIEAPDVPAAGYRLYLFYP